MNARWVSIIFAAGLGAGLLISVGGMRESAEAAGKKRDPTVVSKREARSANSPHEAKFRSFAKELPKLSDEDKEVFEKSLAPGDRSAAIEAMLAETGPQGISSEARSIIYDILATWVGEDFDGAWAWCRRIENDANRKFVASKLIDELVGKDLDRAFALHLEMVAKDPDFSSDAPIKFLHKATSKDAATFLDFLGKLPFGRISDSSEVTFPENFDFQQAADGVTALMKNHNETEPPVFPDNFLSTWAEHNADAAYAWVVKTQHFIGTEGFDSFLEGIDKQSAPGASYKWAAGKLSAAGDEWDTMIYSLSIDGSEHRDAAILSIAQAMPAAANRDRFLGDLMTASCDTNVPVELGVLNEISTPTARLETLRRIEDRGYLNTAEISDVRLQQWGLTRQQVEQLRSSGR